MKYLNRSILLFLFGVGYFWFMIFALVGIDDKTIVNNILLFNCIISGSAGVLGIRAANASNIDNKSIIAYTGIALNSLLLIALATVIIIIFKEW